MTSSLSFLHPVKLIGTCFGVGLSPKAPGTMASIAALPIAYAIQVYGSSMALLIAAVMIFVIGCIVCEKYLAFTDSSDPQEMVIDEVAGQWLLLSAMHPTWISYLAGLLLFRLFDIVKPWPVSWADRKIRGGFGIMFDDALAALYPMALFWLAALAAPIFGYPHLMDSVSWFLSRPYVF